MGDSFTVLPSYSFKLSLVILLAKWVYQLGLWGCICQGYKIAYYPVVLIVIPLGLFQIEGNILINQLNNEAR